MSYGEEVMVEDIASRFHAASEGNLDSSAEFGRFDWSSSSSNVHSEAFSQNTPLNMGSAMAVIARTGVLADEAATTAKAAEEEVVVPGDRDITFDELSYRAALVSRTLYFLVLDTADVFLSWLKWPTFIFLTWAALNFFFYMKPSEYTGYQPVDVVCQFPNLLSWSVWPCKARNPIGPLDVDFSRLSEAEGDALQAVLEESTGLAEVGWDLAQSEIAIGDLIRHVHVSSIISKRPLLSALGELQQQIQASVSALRTLRSTMIGSVQRTMAVNEYTSHALGRLIPDWKSFIFPAIEVRTAALVRHHFDYSIEAFVNGTAQVLIQCKLSIDRLESMAGTLSVIHEIISREHGLLLAEHDELRSSLWTMLGGNRERLRGLGQQLVLFGGVKNHRAKALRHARRTMDSVLDIQEDVWRIRNEVAVVDLPTHRITPKYMEQQLYGITAAMARIAERMDDVRRRNLRLERDMKSESNSGVDRLYE